MWHTSAKLKKKVSLSDVCVCVCVSVFTKGVGLERGLSRKSKPFSVSVARYRLDATRRFGVYQANLLGVARLNRGVLRRRCGMERGGGGKFVLIFCNNRVLISEIILKRAGKIERTEIIGDAV